jgi:hypothetical protein
MCRYQNVQAAHLQPATGSDMSVSSIGGANANYPTQAPQRTAESAEVKGAGGDNDGDADDGGAKAQAAAASAAPHISKPTATMGNHVNTVA